MSRAVINVATGGYVRGQARLWNCDFLDGYGFALNGRISEPSNNGHMFMAWADTMPPGSPSHRDVPYAFKAFAMQAAADAGHKTLLWADASILPIAPLDSLFEKIERDGAWISRNGFANDVWTPDSAYEHIGVTREQNSKIEHVVATTFGISLNHHVGRFILLQYLQMAQSGAFRGPWMNSNHPENFGKPISDRCSSCGPPHVRGARHDQTALSVIAWRAKVDLTNPPEFFSYTRSPETILLADSSY